MDEFKIALDFSSKDSTDPEVQLNTRLFTEFVANLLTNKAINTAFDHPPPKNIKLALLRIQDHINVQRRYPAPPVAQSFDATSGPLSTAAVKEEVYPEGLR